MDFLNAQVWKERLHRAVIALLLLGALVPSIRAQVGVAPRIDVQPLGQSVKKGGTAIFTVEVFSLSSVSYQWYRNSNAIAGATGSTYTRANLDFPDAGFYHVVVVNPIGNTKSDVVALTVVSNTVPVGIGDTFSTLEDVRLTVPAPGVLTNDLDAEGDTLTAVLASDVVNGTLSFNANGSFVYTPNTNFFGGDSFSYYATDGETVILEKNASGGNKLEIDRGTGSQSFRHGTAGDPAYSVKKVLLRLSKKSDQIQNLNFSIGTGRNSGPIAGSSYTITMASISNNTEGASFQDYEIVYSTPVGSLVAGTTYYLNLENASTGGKRLFVEVASGNAYANGNFYRNGLDQSKDMVFEIHEQPTSSLTTVTLDVTAVNDAPLTVNDTAHTLEDTSVMIEVLANDSDVEGTPLTITDTSTTNGTAFVSGNNVLFTPAIDFYGVAVFSYTVSDGVASATGLVTVVVAPVNDASPVAYDDSYTILEDATLSVAAPGILSNDTDVDGDALTALLVSNVSNGILTLNSNGSFIYNPNSNFNGSDSFTYRANDGVAAGNLATVTFTVTALDDAPVANADFAFALEDVPVTIHALTNDFDPEGALLTITGTSTTNGTAIISGANIIFTPSTNFYGWTLFSYTVSDGSLSTTGYVAVLTFAVNDTPLANNETYTTAEDAPLIISAPGILGNDTDVDGDPLFALVLTNVSHGSLNLNTNGAFIYTPSSNYNGSDSFSYWATDGQNALLQQNSSGESKVDIKLGQKGAQSFRYGAVGGPSYTISSVWLLLSRDVQAPNANLNFSIGSGVNSSAIAGSSVAIAPSGITNSAGSSFQYYPIFFGAPVGPLTAGTTYYLNLECEASNGKTIYVQYTESDAYANGTYFNSGSDDEKDINFLIYGNSSAEIATVTINVTPVNDRPLAVNEGTNTLEDTSVTIKVLANDNDVEGNSLTITGTSTTNGTAIISGTNIVFTPATDFYGTAVFSYTISDGSLSATGSVTVSVVSVNDAPRAFNDSTNTMEDTSVTIKVLLNDSDVEGSALTILSATTTNGTAVVSGTNIVFTPSANFNGTAVFSYTISDGSLFATGSVTVAVAAVNDAPIVVNDSTNTLEDVSVTVRVLANDFDVEGTALTLTSASTTNGTATVSGTNVVFRAATNFFGTVVFSYVVSDGNKFSTGIVTVAIASVNDAPPVAADNSYTTPEDVPRTVNGTGVLGNDTDVDGDAMTAILVSSVSNGTLSFTSSNGRFTYTPNTNFYGSDSFTYRATDGLATGNVATVTITVTPVNDSPIVNNDSATAMEDMWIAINVLTNDVDPEGTLLNFTAITGTNGSYATTATNRNVILFLPSTNYNGLVAFSYTVSDGTNSATANVTVSVSPAYDVPVAVNDSTNTTEDVSVTVNVLANEYNPDGLLLTMTNAWTTNGTAFISGTNVIFTPSTNFNGPGVFSYVISDGFSFSTGTVTVAVAPVNDAPRGNNDTYTTLEDVQLVIPAPGILTNDIDVDGNPLTTLLISNVSNGLLTFSTNGSFTYRPNTNYNGSDSFTYVPLDGQATGNLARVTINITPVNDAPIAGNDSTNTTEDTSVTIKVLLNDSDPEGSPLTITGRSTTNGTAVISGTNIVFTPSTNFIGTAVFTYIISDSVYFATGSVTVTVTAVNDAPVAVNDSTNTLEDVSVTIKVLGNDTDVEGTALSLTSTSTTNGTAAISGTNIVFTPATNYYGTVVFTYRASDGSKFATGTVTVAVAPVNDGPVANNDTYTTLEDTPLIIPAAGILANDLDPEGQPFTALLVSGVAYGSLSLNLDGSFTYTPEANYSGSDSFTYRATDGLAVGNVATVTINITSVVDPLRFVSQQRVTNGMRLELLGPKASFYVIQSSSNVVDWVSISTNFAPQGAVAFIDTAATNQGNCFYRATIRAATNLEQNVTGGARVEINPILPGAQSFRYGTSGGSNYGISKIVIRISRDSPAPNGSLTFSIGAGINSGTVAGSTFAIPVASVSNNTAGTSFQTYEIVYPEPIGPFTAGTTYYLNFVTQSTNGQEYWLERSSGTSTYSRGTFYSGSSDISRDMRFEIWGQ